MEMTNSTFTDWAKLMTAPDEHSSVIERQYKNREYEIVGKVTTLTGADAGWYMIKQETGHGRLHADEVLLMELHARAGGGEPEGTAPRGRPADRRGRDRHRDRRRELFHDTPDQRLGEVEGGFDAALPVLIELELRPEFSAALPERDLETLAGAARTRCARTPGTRARSGRSTPCPRRWAAARSRSATARVFSAPRNEIDALRRRGPVSRTIVGAFVENGLPVRFEDDAFVAGLGVAGREYTCRVRPLDDIAGLELTVIARGLHADPGRIARELPAGRFEAGEDGTRYIHEIRVAPDLVSEAWVIETLRAGVSVLDALVRPHAV